MRKLSPEIEGLAQHRAGNWGIQGLNLIHLISSPPATFLHREDFYASIEVVSKNDPLKV